MVERLRSMAEVISGTDERVAAGGRAAAHVWPTGFVPLDEHLGGGLRAGELVLLGGPQGLGKTTFALQMFRNIAAGGGRAIYFSYEHEETSLLERLLVQEAVERAGSRAATLQELRRRLEAGSDGGHPPGLEALLEPVPGMLEARAALESYGQQLTVVEASGRSTTADVIRELVLEATASAGPSAVFVDYLQKVSSPSSLAEDERVTVVVEALKDLALEAAVPVVAIVAASQEGIAPGHRLRVHELRGSSALAYEADVILLFNDKYDIVAKHHLVYDPRSAERFRQIAVLTIEKNRSGRDHIDMEFRKEFERCRFDPLGNLVAEQLSDARIRVDADGL